MLKLRDWRKKHGLTQQQVAESLGVTNSAITKYEKGSQRPRPELAERIESLTCGEVTAASLLGLARPRTAERGLREDTAAFITSEEITISFAIPADRAGMLQRAGVDSEAIARAGAEKALKEAEAQAWAAENREAIAAANAWIEKHGTLAEQLGLI